MFIETVSHSDATYESAERLTLNDAQEAPWLSSMEDQDNDNDGIVLIMMIIKVNFLSRWHGMSMIYDSLISLGCLGFTGYPRVVYEVQRE